MGRHTDELGLRQGLTDPYPQLGRTVVSTTFGPAADVTVTPDPVAAVERLLAGDGLGVWLCGGGTLAGALLAHVDRLVLERRSLVLGAGRPLVDGTYRPCRFGPVAHRTLGEATIETSAWRAG